MAILGNDIDDGTRVEPERRPWTTIRSVALEPSRVSRIDLPGGANDERDGERASHGERGNRASHGERSERGTRGERASHGEIEALAAIGLLVAVLVLAIGAVAGPASIPGADGLLDDGADGEPEIPSGNGNADVGTEDDGVASGHRTRVTVIEVVDGDTMHVRLPDGSRDTIRLLGVDTPEVGDGNVDPAEWEGIPDDEAGRTWLAAWGDRASVHAETRLAGEDVYVETDPTADYRGSYDRLLVYVYRNESARTSFNRRLIDEGYARLYESEFERRSAYRSAETAAREDGVGAWGYEEGAWTDGGRVVDGAGATSEGGLAVVAIHADAEGNDHENRNGEYVTLENRGTDPIALGGWTLSDAAGNAYSFPDGFELEPGDHVTVYTGDGADTDTELYWGSDRAVWNNDGDTVIVRSADGTTRIEYAY
ncbi:lamin tail domain-containing protein [Halopenitus salinus]|uniref:lamin tail domain-containing protein n=1 Tax=Halopenitus salinus TaxID=1198295 RepID=UPI0036D3814F